MSAEFDPFAGPAIALVAPTTEAQREIWTAARMGDEVSLAFNESGQLTLEGPLDVPAFERAFAQLVARHEALRTTFSPDGTQVTVAPEGNVPLVHLDVAALPEAERAGRVKRLHLEQVTVPFVLEQGPLLRGTLVKRSPTSHALVLTAHHAVCDGYSTGVLLKDLGALYTAEHAGRAAQLPAPVPYSVYGRELAERARSPEHAADEAFWVARFKALPPNLDLPADRMRPPLRRLHAARVDHTLGPELVDALRKTGRKLGSSFFATLLAGFDALLFRVSGQTDLVTVIPTAGQATAGHPTVVGHCVNALPVRVAVDPEAPFATLVTTARTALLDAQEHGQYTLGELLRVLPVPRDPSRLPLASVCFNLDLALAGPSLGFEGLTAGFDSIARTAENFDLFVNAVDTGATVVLETQYSTELFDEATVRGWLGTFEVLLRGAAQEPQTKVSRLPVLTSADADALSGWNQTQRALPARIPAALVAEVAARTPQAVAVTYAGTSLRYAELDARANQLARRLMARGVGPGVLVGLCLERTPELLVALLAVQRAGGGYVPLDPSYPPDRLTFMLQASRAPLLLTQEKLRGLMPFAPEGIISVDGEAAAIAGESPAPVPPAPGASLEDVAYVIYTSGSTGKPKGVAVPLRAMGNLIQFAAQAPGMGAQDTVVALTTLSFDIAVFELWLPLTVGARILLAGRDAGADGVALMKLVEQERATVLQATPATWRLLLGAGWEPKRPVKLISTGEAMPRDLGTELVSKSNDVWDMYGPTETCVWSTWWKVPNPVGTVLIGKPIANTQLHVLDAHLQPVPVGVVGELWIGGVGVALGYLHQPELTAERFVPDPFRAGGTLYKTGDQGRWRRDGQLEYLGRNDHQVKVRGFRIELGEIEATLGAHATVRQAVAMAREDKPGDVRLVAYVVAKPGQAAAEDTLRAHLKASLPEYMVPQHFVTLEHFPVTPNGKVDRKALPPPELGVSSQEEYVAPRDEAERMLAQLWQEALGISRVSIHDDFFALGGHSLLAAQIVGRLGREHGRTVPMRKMFEHPTVAKFAPLLSAERPVVSIPPLPEGAPAAGSFMQERTYQLEQLSPGRAVFNLPSAFRLRGKLNHAALEQSLAAFYARHESTRTTLKTQGDLVVQEVAAQLDATLTPIDLSALPPAEREAELMRRLLASSLVPFDLTRGPLVRALLFRLAPEEHVVFFMPHHAVWDGWSFDVLVRDWSELYAAACEERPARLPALPLRYRDFAAWHRTWLQSPEVEKQAEYWRTQLAGTPPPLELPTDRPRTRALGDGGGTLWVEIPRAEADALTAVGQRHGATLFMVMLAAYSTLLHRLSGQQEVLIGTPVRGRSQPHTEDVVGTFINTLVLRINLGGSPTFAQLLGRIRSTVLDAFAHEDVPFELLSMSKKPAFRALFSFQDARARPARFGGLTMGQVHVLPPVAANDVSLWVMEKDFGLLGGFNYSAELFDGATMERVLASLRTLLKSVVESPTTGIDRLSLATEAEASTLEGGAGAAPVPAVRAFAEHAARTPEAAAVTGQHARLSYGELRARAAGLASRLREAGVAPGARVAVLVEPSPDGVVGTVAIAMAGAVSVPLDSSWPPARIAQLVAEAKPVVVLAAGSQPEGLEAFAGKVLTFTGASSEAPLGADASVGAVLFSSDSGGHPRAVALGSNSISASVAGVAKLAGLGAGDVLLSAGALASGSGLAECWLALSTGAALTIAPEVLDDGVTLKTALAQTKATALHASAGEFRALAQAGWQGGPGFKALCAGPIDAPLTVELMARAGLAVSLLGGMEIGLWAGGGVLPAAVAATAGSNGAPSSGAPSHGAGATDAASSDAPAALIHTPSLGAPFAGGRWRVLDAQQQPVPRGLPGELWVEGPTLADGSDGRSGEKVRLRADGAVESLGRVDLRATVRGHRVELRELERALATHPAVAQAFAGTRLDEVGEPRLVAWVLRKPGQEATASELRAHLRALLPAEAVPRRIEELEATPGGAAGVDRAALPSPFQEALREHQEPRTEEEKLLAAVWKEALSLSRVSLKDNFFDLGGHSLLCLQVVTALEKRTGKRLSPRSLLLNTLEQAAVQLAATR